MRKIKNLIILFTLLILWDLKAQELYFSQFYSNPILLNPALTGSGHGPRIGVSSKIHFPSISDDLPLTSNLVFFDNFSPKMNSGYGIQIRNTQLNDDFRNLAVTLSFSYLLQVGTKGHLRFGSQVELTNHRLLNQNFIFEDQIDPVTGAIQEELNLENNFREEISYASINSGVLYTNENFWLGLSARHLNKPNISYERKNVYNKNILYSIHGGYRFPIGISIVQKERDIAFSFNFRSEGEANRLDIGTQANLSPLVLGIWYTGIPIESKRLQKTDSLNFLVGLNISQSISFAYSYDMLLSPLRNIKSAASHEISLQISFSNNQSSKSFKELPCFKY